ncbi:DegV family protein [Anaerosinus massiliensis]|uniref:DegV family protein n=1 Tax=Massilibacillus massiliensis TaxID=1806837 RepID=UPI000B20D73C|nr:DegV family protein [Massilibacillus massiliensis]
MNRIHIVLDSTAHIEDELLQKHKYLHRVELKVSIADREWDEDDLSPRALFAETKKSGVMQRTSQPPIGDFVTLFQSIAEQGDECIVIAVSGALSGTVQTARAAAQMVDASKIHVVDSQTAAIGMLRLAETALALREEGKKAEEILAVLQKQVKATHTLLLPDSLEYLHRGGRIGGAAALFGTILQIKPVLYLSEGKIAVLDKVRTRKKAINRLIEELAQYKELDYIGVVEVEAEEGPQTKERIMELYPDSRVSLTSAGSVVASHTGPGALALIFQEKIEK